MQTKAQHKYSPLTYTSQALRGNCPLTNSPQPYGLQYGIMWHGKNPWPNSGHLAWLRSSPAVASPDRWLFLTKQPTLAWAVIPSLSSNQDISVLLTQQKYLQLFCFSSTPEMIPGANQTGTQTQTNGAVLTVSSLLNIYFVIL